MNLRMAENMRSAKESRKFIAEKIELVRYVLSMNAKVLFANFVVAQINCPHDLKLPVLIISKLTGKSYLNLSPVYVKRVSTVWLKKPRAYGSATLR